MVLVTVVLSGSCPRWQLSAVAVVIGSTCLVAVARWQLSSSGRCPSGCSPRTRVNLWLHSQRHEGKDSLVIELNTKAM